jgi:tetraacyldisaccharide 4'-kinase
MAMRQSPASTAIVRAPEFWTQRGLVPTLLEPLATLYAAAGAAREMLTTPFRAAVPVICVGNLIAGGSGKTPVVLSLAQVLRASGHRPHIVMRGYGGRLSGPVLADPARHGAADIGDEALLLAPTTPCWISRDRVAGAKAAIAAGADLVLLDDGFQNPSLAKDLSFIVVDGAYGFGNRRLIPAGPLREPIERGLGRGDAVVIIGTDSSGTAAAIGDRLPILHATLEPQGGDEFVGRKVLAFAGIGRPAKFYATLAGLGAEIVAHRDFPDHHPYSAAEIGQLVAAAQARDALLVTTAKDRVRVPETLRAGIAVLEVAIAWREPERLSALLSRALPVPAAHG